MSNRWRAGRELFLQRNPVGPWLCAYCQEPITERTGKSAQSLVVHHKDDDHYNNVPGNHDPMHFGCHAKHHKRGWKPSKEVTAAQKAAVTGVPKTAEHREKIRAALIAHHERRRHEQRV